MCEFCEKERDREREVMICHQCEMDFADLGIDNHTLKKGMATLEGELSNLMKTIKELKTKHGMYFTEIESLKEEITSMRRGFSEIAVVCRSETNRNG